MWVATRRALAVAAAAGAALAGSASAGGAPVGLIRSGGLIHIYATGSATSSRQQVVITGAFGDAGWFTGGVGELGTITLSKGSFRVNDSKGTAQELAIFAHIARHVNAATCAFYSTNTAPAILLDGKGAYAGISGTISLTTIDAGVFPKLKGGRCDVTHGAVPIGLLSLAQGVGTVSFH
jgi:hypothetical protein